MLKQLFLSMKQNIFFSLFGFILVLFQITGFLLATFENITCSFLVTTAVLLVSILFGSLLGILIGFLYSKIYFDPEKRLYRHVCSNDTFCFFIFIIIAISYVPIFLTYFPGILSYDFMIQLGQVQSGNYSDQLPFVHTFMIQFFYNFGVEFLLSGSLGIGLYTIAQFFFLAFACTYSLFILFLLKVEKRYIFLILLFYMFFPNIQFMSISTTADTIFAAFVLILISSLAYLFTTKSRGAFFSCHITMFIIGILGTLAFKNNGIYALLATIVVACIVLIFYKNKRLHILKVISIMLASTLIGFFFLSTIATATCYTQGDRSEMLSIPIQQFTSIDTNPSDYINAFSVQNIGFLYIFDTSHATINSVDEMSGYGYIQTHEFWDDLAAADIYKSSFFETAYYYLEEWTNSNAYLNIPVLNLFMAPGIWLYFVLFLVACVFHDKRYGFLIPLAFLLGYYLTIILGPTVQLRYIFPVMLCIPTLTILYLSRKEPHASTRNNESKTLYE
ncbi:MAG: DUF6020 family protein [Lachnospiraceae bacterium]